MKIAQTPRKQPKRTNLQTIILGVILILIASVAGSWYLSQRMGKSQNERNTSSLTLLKSITKFYPDITWSDVQMVTISYQQYTPSYTSNRSDIAAYQITGKGILPSADTCMTRCELPFLTDKQWIKDTNQIADGPNGSLWGYRRNNENKQQIIRLQYTNKTMLTDGVMRVVCPCNVEYRLAISDVF